MMILLVFLNYTAPITFMQYNFINE